jgi:NAD(P)-dependent dehydrogenase (short-subunit alcohol dehydrogenase family)
MLRGAAGEDLAEPRLDPLEVLVPCGKDAGLGEHVAHMVQGGGLGLLVEQGVGELPVMGCLGRSAQGWDLAFATNHLGPLAFTEALIPHVPDGANVVFTCSGVEDPERKPARGVGFRGGRYISAEASARGEWAPGGSSKPGMGAYATSKQCELATVFAVAREMPRLRFNAVEPGFSPGTGLGRDAADGIELSADVLDRIDQIVPPAVTINVADNMWNIGTTALDTAFRRR